jgi:hypothetical protein
MEIESALVAHPKVAEAAVVAKPHEIKGESAFAYVVLNVPRPEGAAATALVNELRVWVGDQLSPIAKPDEIRLTDNLPKTRSGKIMRRLLRAVARGEPITQDMSTLENPAILEQLRGGAPAPAAKQTGARRKAAMKMTPPKAAKKSAKGAAKSRRAKSPKRAAKSAKRAAKSKRQAAKSARRVKKAKGAAKSAKRKMARASTRSRAHSRGVKARTKRAKPALAKARARR